MILPSKYLVQERALLTVGARLLVYLRQPMTVSALWEEISHPISTKESEKRALRYDAYILALDLLFLLGAIELRDGLLRRNSP